MEGDFGEVWGRWDWICAWGINEIKFSIFVRTMNFCGSVRSVGTSLTRKRVTRELSTSSTESTHDKSFRLKILR